MMYVWETNRTKSALRSLEEKNGTIYKILLTEQSDVFDPNGSNKNNRGSIHITIFSLFGKNTNNVQLLFPSTINHNKSDYIIARKRVYEDLRQFGKPFSLFDSNKFIKIQIILFITIQDWVERSAAADHGYP